MAELVDRSLGWFSGLLGSLGRCVESLRWCPGSIPVMLGLESGLGALVVFLTSGRGLLGWLAGAGRLWRGWSAAAQRSLHDGARHRRWLGFEAARAWR
jgi:hypothetical protein